MAYDFTPLINFLDHVFQRFRSDHPKPGKPYTYSEVGMILFFMTMFVKRLFAFKAMARYAKEHSQCFGFARAPSRQTIRRRFAALPKLLQQIIPVVADDAGALDERFASSGIGVIDKCLFWAKGGVWHKKQMKAGIVPIPTIDTEPPGALPPIAHAGSLAMAYMLSSLASAFPSQPV